MTPKASQFLGDVPEFYERHLVPVIFEPYAQDLIQRIGKRPEGRLLELACGTGVVTRSLLPRLGANARLVATDLNQAMVDEAQQRVPEDARLTWRTADAQALPFGDAEFDLAFCQFGWMFLPDKVQGFREVRRVLKPGAPLLFNLWDTFATNSFGRLTHETIVSFFPKDPPPFYLTPFGYNDRAAIEKDLRAAGFKDVAIEEVNKEAVSESAQHFAVGLIRGNPVVAMIRERGGDPEPVIAAVAGRLTQAGGAAPFSAPIRAVVVRATG